MQKIATRVFIIASVVFGIVGILLILTLPPDGEPDSSMLSIILMKTLFTTAFVILPSFALSVAGKYLSSKS